MHNPWFNIGTIPISGTGNSTGSIPLVRARTVTITARVTFPALADVDATVKVYYSPDGNNWDTTVYTSFALAFAASTTVQRTVIIDPPEHGYLRVAILNGSAAVTLTLAHVWYTIQSWGATGDVGHGMTYIDTGEERQIIEKETKGP